VQLQAQAGAAHQCVHKKAAHVIRVGRNVGRGRKTAHLALPILTIIVPLGRHGAFLRSGGGALERRIQHKDAAAWLFLLKALGQPVASTGVHRNGQTFGDHRVAFQTGREPLDDPCRSSLRRRRRRRPPAAAVAGNSIISISIRICIRRNEDAERRRCTSSMLLCGGCTILCIIRPAQLFLRLSGLAAAAAAVVAQRPPNTE
jgi:hypothetical protein